MKSIYEIARENPDRWLKADSFEDEEQLWDLAETGGMIKFCTTCDTNSSPNRPCFCGLVIIARKDGMFWADENQDEPWTTDWKFKAEHFLSIEEAELVAQALKEDQGELRLCRIGAKKQ